MPPYLRMFLVFWTLGLLAFAAEYLFPARVVSYRSVFLRDLVALGVYNLCFLLVVPLTDRIPIPDYAPDGPIETATGIQAAAVLYRRRFRPLLGPSPDAYETLVANA
jgi:hypothetical protein